ncbi:NADH-quinone oxidoreductase subunit J [Craterilacuibacter sinensis]|uniref:NADH-quinone oxidoreductase subunit J n=1 Tax=Craterilacuibacter sinensis TaxID=2686017 RepID=A0A845BLX7_9NEIS|nr:NADH-quinone oxidoreductase subunit J [Craterilacuibacter sinensis]MXR35461.1 NADH-quinone oxidoreductase subunit J [Craterilacuibacter sinensis]RQW28711.1 NADH-quinone oxidoreductase subunit J [Rhodobacteraceae bacterium CH30]
MSFPLIVFYVLSAILLFSAFKVVTAKNPVHAALWLVLAFFTSSGHWLLLQAEFLAIALVLVYVGAVMVLFLFVVMMLDINIEKMRAGFWQHFPLAATVGLIMVAEMVLILASPQAHLAGYEAAAPLAADASNVKVLGLQIYTTYLMPFELAAVLLLLAIVAAIALTQRERKDGKYVDPAMQVEVKAADRLSIVKMAAVRDEPVINETNEPQA